MYGSEATLINNLATEKTNQNTFEYGNETSAINENSPTKIKKMQISIIEEKLRVISPQTSKKKQKIVDVSNLKYKRPNLVNMIPMSNVNLRKDCNGVEIKSSNKKRVKVSYIDKISTNPLVNVVLIESMKQYNTCPFGKSEESYIKTKQSCSCNTF